MPIKRMAPWLLLILMAGLPDAAGEEASTLVANGEARLLVLGGERSMQVLRVVAPRGARALHVLAAASYDIDLYVHDQPLDEEDTEDAAHQADSLLTVEHLVIRPDQSAIFQADETLFVHVVSPWSRSRACKISLTAAIEREVPVLETGRPSPLGIPAGEPSVTATAMVPHGLANAAFTAETHRGIPSLHATYGDLKAVGVRRGMHALAWIDTSGKRTAGLWTVQLSRPPSIPIGEPCTVSLELSLLTKQGAEDTWGDDEATPLFGRQGTRTLRIEEDDAEQVFLDVTPATQSLRLRAFAADGDVDLYVTRHRPVRMGDPTNWDYCMWKDGAEEVLFVGGEAPLPVGRYWIRVKHVSGDDDDITLEYERRARPLTKEERPVVQGTLTESAQAVRLAANQPISWWALSRPLSRTTGLRMFDADKDMDLLIQRADSGAIIRRSTSDRHAEGLLVTEWPVLPEGIGVNVGVCRWNVTHPIYAGELHLSRNGLPPIPPSYFPPYDVFGKDARARTLAASVHIDLEDSSASGVVVSPSGLILTCHHVVETVLDGGEIRIAFPVTSRGRPREVYFAEVIDTREPDDLALLRITRDVFGGDIPSTRRHPYVPLGSSRATALEAPLRIVAYGRAGSSSFNSNLVVLHGVLAGVEVEGDEEIWLITDARTGPGNSGGGYFDAAGRLVGVHTSSIGDRGSALGYGKPLSALPATWRQRIEDEGGTSTPR